jgi:hypothetical protein
VNDLSNAIVNCDVIQYADDTVLLIKSHHEDGRLTERAEEAIASALEWFAANRLEINARKTTFIVFGHPKPSPSVLKVGGEYVLCAKQVVYLGLRIDTKLQWLGHINYVISRIRQVRIVCRYSYLFDRSLRVCLCKSLIFPIISQYDYIYASAPRKYLNHLNTAYNQLTRTVLGLKRSQHVTVKEMYALSSFVPLATRRHESLLIMYDVKSGRQFRAIRTVFTKMCHSYATHNCDNYVIPKSSTSIGRERISVRGLALLNGSRVAATG